MQPRYLLYIDILGFSDLVANEPERVDDLYEIIASLNAHRHDAFKSIIFSDTILVYNRDGSDTPADTHYFVMFLCEFARDLLHRLTGRGIYFRAVITSGTFRHYELNGIPCFFGASLIEAYTSEKQLKAIGLFIDRRLERFCDIFSFRIFNEAFSFVYTTQALDTLERESGGRFPFDADYLGQTELIWFVTPELLYLQRVHEALASGLPDHVAQKYVTTWQLYKARYPKIIAHFETHNFDLKAISPRADWDKVISRYPEDYSWAVRDRKEF